MKKLITILAIMIVLVGAVFADPVTGSNEANGSASINITATVAETFPAFGLKTVAGAAEQISTVAGTAPNAAMTYTSAQLIGDTALTVTFKIVQTQPSRTSATYRFSYTATPLYLMSTADGETVRSTIPESSQGVATDELFTVKTLGAIATEGVTGTSFNTTNKDLHYDGSVVGSSATAAAPLAVANFEVTWNNNANAKAGNYKGTVTLTVQAQ